MYVLVCIYPTPPHEQDVTQGQFLSGVEQVWIEFTFSLTGCHAKVPSLPFCLHIAGWRRGVYIPFSRLLELCEIKTATSRTCVVVSFSYDDIVYVCAYVSNREYSFFLSAISFLRIRVFDERSSVQ